MNPLLHLLNLLLPALLLIYLYKTSTHSPSKPTIYATYLGPLRDYFNHPITPFHNSSDPYFDAVRILTYQILHCPQTRTQNNIPFVVFTQEAVSADKKAQLRSDGALVIEWADFSVDWVKPKDKRWVDIMTKLRLWEMEQFGMIIFLDADSVLSRPIDGIIHSPAVRDVSVKESEKKYHGVELPLPETYLLAATPQLRLNHTPNPSQVPSDYWSWENLNSGFMVLRPSVQIFKYFEAVLAQRDSFDGSIGDQSVLNYVFAMQGPMPWAMLEREWNVQWPWEEDVRAGYAVFHEKWWAPVHREVGGYFLGWYWRMVGFFDGR